MRTFHTGGAVEDVSEARQHRILSKVSGTVHFRDFQPGRTVKKERELWIATENRANLDGPAYKVQQVNHPDCQLREGELLSEKQYSENTERYKGFDTKTWQYEVTAVLDSGCDLKVGAQLSQVEHNKALAEYGFHRFVTLHYRVTQVQHPDISVAVGDLLTEKEVAQLKDGVRHGFNVELYYLNPETDELVKEEDLKLTSNAPLEQTNAAADDEEGDVGFKRVYRVIDVDEKVQKSFPFKAGQEVPAEEMTPWLTPFEVDAKPIYVVNEEIRNGSSLLEQPTLPSDTEQLDAAPLKAGHQLNASEYERACTMYRDNGWAFKVEKQETERHRVTKVYHSECPLKVGEELTEEALTRAHRRFKGFDEQKLRHRVTQVHHPDCSLKPGNLLGESEAKQYHDDFPGLTTSTSEIVTGGFETKRLYRITAVNHSDCPLAVDELLTQQEATAKRRQYKGLEVARYYKVTSVEDGTAAVNVGDRLTEIEYKALRKTDATFTEKVTSLHEVISVHHPELERELEAGTELTDEDYKTYNRKFKGFDTELVYEIVKDNRDTDTPLEPGTILPSKEYRALEKANKKILHTVTAVYHPNCKYALDDELSAEDYADAKVRYPGFEVDELSLQMRIEVETSDGTRVPHVIPADYSFSLTEGDSIRKGETLAELHERTANLDIVAGIPRVTDLFEARRLKRGDAAQIAEIEGYVRSTGTKGGVPTYCIEHKDEHGEYKSGTYQIPDEKRRVAEGDWVNAGEPLTSRFPQSARYFEYRAHHH